MRNITYIISDIDKAVAFEWISENLDKKKYKLSFILINKGGSHLEDYLKERSIEYYRVEIKSRKEYISAFFKILRILKRIKPNVVHTHLRDANYLGLFSAKVLGIKNRIYTRHHSTYHHDKFPKAVKYDKFVNFLATDIVAISENVKSVLKNRENVIAKKIHLIHHGFDLSHFNNVPENQIALLKNKYIPDNRYPIIGVIARYISWKGHIYQIKAFKQILEKYPNAYFVFANANGPDKEKIQSQLSEYLPEASYEEIEFENNLFALYRLFDIYVHTPINKEVEAFGQTYVEALASGIPSVFTLSGVANEFIKHKENALIVDYKNNDQIYKSIINILEDSSLKEQLVDNGFKSVERFNLNKFITSLEKIYE